jgi:hypothetical protein
MTDDMIALRELLEKGSDATLLREMIGFAAQRLMELEARRRAAPATASAARTAPTCAMATAIATGTRVLARWSCASQSSARAAIFRAFSSHVEWRRRR